MFWAFGGGLGAEGAGFVGGVDFDGDIKLAEVALHEGKDGVPGEVAVAAAKGWKSNRLDFPGGCVRDEVL